MNRSYSVIVNAVIRKEDKILISQRSFEEAHEPGKWTIPGGKIENDINEVEIFDIVEKTLKKEVLEEVEICISDEVRLIANNTFQRSNGQTVLALVFLCQYKSGEAKPAEDTIAVKWITKAELGNYAFPPNVKEYITRGYVI